MKGHEVGDMLCLHLRGTFLLIGNERSNFVGPIKAGLRLVMWGNTDKKATSCVFVNDLNLRKGQSGACEVIILSPLSIDKKIQVDEIYPIGIPGIKLGEFLIKNIVGEWQGKLPT